MNSNEWQQIGEDIKKQVQSAIDSNDFSELSKTISNTVNQAIGDVSKGMNHAVNGMRETFQQTIQKTPRTPNYSDQSAAVSNGYQNSSMGGYPNPPQSMEPARPAEHRPQNGGVYYGKPDLRPDRRFFVRSPKGNVSGVLYMALGFSAFGIMGILFCIALIMALFQEVPLAAIGIPGFFTALGLFCGIRGIGLKGRANRFKRYVSMLQDKLYCSIEDLAAGTGHKKKFILKDVKRMMRNGWFLQGHLDKQESCLMVSDQVYEQYRLTQQNYEEEQKKQALQDLDKTREISDRERTECEKILEEGKEYIRVIRVCNSEIPGEEMSGKLDKLEFLVTRIFAQVEKEPELAPDLHKMLNYYLPTTQKLLEAYRDLDRQNVEVSNISQTKKEIEATIDTINQAFEKFLDELFRETAWDIQTDISVLHTMLKQDGYLSGDFEKK